MTSINFDIFGYIPISCENIYQIYLFSSNAMNTGLNFSLSNRRYYTIMNDNSSFIISNVNSEGK
jgi:hypothetical protein